MSYFAPEFPITYYYNQNKLLLFQLMSFVTTQLTEQQKIDQLTSEIYQPLRSNNCNQHHLPKDVTCLQSKCANYCQPTCKQCHHQHAQYLIGVNRLVPKLAQWAREEWGRMRAEQKEVESEWKISLVNIDYCLDILKQVRKQVEGRSAGPPLPAFREILSEIHSMFIRNDGNITPEALLKSFKRLNERYNLIQNEQIPPVCSQTEHQREHRHKQASQASATTKAFSEQALLFSQKLARLTEEKIRAEQRVSRLREISNNRLVSLRDLIKDQRPQEVGQLLIELPKPVKGKAKNQEQQDALASLEKCANLKILRVNNRSGALGKAGWAQILTGMERLKFLKELVLNIRASQLQVLTKLFKERNKAVRQVQKLTLQITDEKELDIPSVCAFINTMELRSLNLTLARDNLRKAQATQLLTQLRFSTSMSQLPLNELHINLHKNAISEVDTIEIDHLFENRAHSIKQRSIAM